MHCSYQAGRRVRCPRAAQWTDTVVHTVDPDVVQWTRSAEERAGTPLLVALHGDGRVAAVRPRVFLGHGDADTAIPAGATLRTSAWAASHTRLTARTDSGPAHAVSAAEFVGAAALVGG